jgi:hypothetical protein
MGGKTGEVNSMKIYITHNVTFLQVLIVLQNEISINDNIAKFPLT